MIKPRRLDIDRSDGMPLSIVSQLLFPDHPRGSKAQLARGVAQCLLVGYGIPRGKTRRDLIERELWDGFNIDLAASRLSDDGGRQIDGVTIFPVLQAPDAVQLIAGRSLREIFHRFVRHDPLVAIMGDIAAKSLPGWGETVMRGKGCVCVQCDAEPRRDGKPPKASVATCPCAKCRLRRERRA